MTMLKAPDGELRRLPFAVRLSPYGIACGLSEGHPCLVVCAGKVVAATTSYDAASGGSKSLDQRLRLARACRTVARDKRPKGPAGRHDVEIARIEERKDARKLDLRYSLLRTALRGLIFLSACFVGYLCLRVIAGTSTTFSAVLKASVDISLDKWLPYAIAAVCGSGWYGERTLRQKVIAKHAPYIRELEEKYDPARSSSHLLPSGKPKKEDKDEP